MDLMVLLYKLYHVMFISNSQCFLNHSVVCADIKLAKDVSSTCRCAALYTACVCKQLTASELSSDLCSRLVAPDIWASAAASASTAPLSSISLSADSLKYPMAATGTESRNLCTMKKWNHVNLWCLQIAWQHEMSFTPGSATALH